jgi:hypothetical protein
MIDVGRRDETGHIPLEITPVTENFPSNLETRAARTP